MLNNKIKAFALVGGMAISLSQPALAKDKVMQSAGALAFDSKNVLFVGDSKAGVVHAFDLPEKSFEDHSGYQWGRAQSFEGRTVVENIDQKIAKLLGASPEDISINDMVVHQPSGEIYLSVHKGHGPKPKPVILKVDNGKLEKVNLKSAKHTSISVGPVPTKETLEFGQPLNSLAITDIDYYDGEIFVAGVSNEVFSSKLRRIPFPFKGEVNTTSIEIWHAVHAQYETRAPIITQTIRELDGKPTLIAIYACTPIVKIPLDELKDGAQVRGTMIGEMGYGNTPIDIVSFTSGMDNNDYVVVTNTNRSAAQIPLQAIATAEAMPSGEGVKPVFQVAGVYQFPLPMSGTLHLDLINDQWAATIRRNPEEVGRIDLHTLPLPFFFDRADHVVEMNWADGPDPFGYKSLPPVKY
ncbi:hypothetical protein GCE9029_01223 [Grimontia celer]|uniref:Uncharacterized protein n=1 Tax=Grimontia celer TaxID=1796497 RepID=A0A128EXW4_9GAMM|nr:hypothetical protein [Grimontia celer]CZF79045.1 hypothetical protein GCE9029_01223 [Grimontia celer]